MPFVLRRPRTLAFLIVVATISTLAIVGSRGGPGVALQVRAAAVGTAGDLPRPAWYGMKLAQEPVEFVVSAASAHPPTIHAAAGILVDIDSNTIVWQQDAHAELPPASTTKILTALVALENFSPERVVTVTPGAAHLGWDESRMGLLAGQTLTMRELLTGMLLVSGNDAASAIADGTVGAERFVGAMNAQVAALGLHDSHFTTPVGLPDPAQYTSAYDLAAISAAAVRRSPVFRDIVASRTADLPATAGHPEFYLNSINTLLSMYPAAVGIKPGWTADAGYCEVGMAVRDGHRLISVLLNAPYDFSQSRRLLDWGFVQEGLPSTLPTPTATPSVKPTLHG
jgi:D-alanyl-D-alanine carboxypeptidase (penicillin-binding protein 5/6)